MILMTMLMILMMTFSLLGPSQAWGADWSRAMANPCRQQGHVAAQSLGVCVYGGLTCAREGCLTIGDPTFYWVLALGGDWTLEPTQALELKQ